MKKIKPAVLQETKHIAVGVGIGTVILLLVLAVIGKLDVKAAYSALLGGAYAIGNFFWLAMSVQKAADTNGDVAKGKSIIKLSYNVRLLVLLGFALLMMRVPVFTWYAALIPVFFPRITIMAMGFIKPKDKGDEAQ